MSEETDLVRQLRKLAAPQTSLLLQDKVRPSLLFDPKEASSLDRDTVFAYGCNGLDKLILIDSNFSKFESTLFSQSIVGFERSVQTKIANENLDEWIEEFLTMLSPYFLLRAAHEALEWLINRFHIHMYNIDALVACVLPYYHTRIFVRVLQLMDLSDEHSRWHWLQPTKKSGKPLELSILLKQFNSDRSFRKFVCNLALKVTKAYEYKADVCNVVLSFASVTVYYALKINKNIDSSLVTLLFPFIISGLKSQIASYCAGVYAIVGILVAKLKFTDELLADLLVKICNNFEPSLLQQGFELIAVIFQHQGIKKIPKNMFNALVDMENSINELKSLSNHYSCEIFIVSLLKKSVPAALKESLMNPGCESKLNFSLGLINNVHFENNAIKICFGVFFNHYVKLHESHNTGVDNLQQAGKLLLKCFENRWPKNFDSAIESFFQENSLKQYRCALELVNASVNDTKHQVLPTHGLTLFLGLNHMNALVRVHAVKALISQVLDANITDKTFIINALLERMSDDNPTVALTVLEEEELLLTLIPKDMLFSALKTLLKIQDTSAKRRKVQLTALKLLCADSYTENEVGNFYLQQFEVVLPFLFPVVSEDLKNFFCVINSPSVDKNPFLSPLKEMASEESVRNISEELLPLNQKVLETLSASISNMEEEFTKPLVHYFIKDLNIYDSENMAVIFAVFLSGQIKMKEGDEMGEYFMHVSAFLRSLACSKKVYVDSFAITLTKDATLERCMKCIQKNQLPLSLICFGFKTLLETLQSSAKLPMRDWWPNDKSDRHFCCLLELFLFFVAESNCMMGKKSNERRKAFKLLLAFLIQKNLKDINCVLWFLSFMWSGHPYVRLNKLCQVSGLQIATVLSEKYLDVEKSSDFIFEISSKSFPTLLVALYSDMEEVRLATSEFLSRCLNHDQGCLAPFKILSQEICSSSEEIRSDREYLIRVFNAWILPAYKLSHKLEGKEESLPANAKAPAQVYSCLLSLTLDKATPCPIRKVLLILLQKADVRTFTDEFLTLLDFYLEKYLSSNQDDIRHVLQLLVDKYSVESAPALTDGSQFLLSYLNLFQNVQLNDVSDTTVLEMALSTLTKDFFFAIPTTAVQQKLMDVLVDLYLNLRETEIHSKVGKLLKKLCSSAYLLLKDLPERKSPDKSTSLRDARKSRLQSENKLTVSTSSAWKKVTVILEIVQNKKTIHDKELLVPELFRLLNYSLDWENQPSVEYIRQLILSGIFTCCKALEPNEIDEHKFQIELVIQCIRTSDNPKTHHHALLLLNLAATVFPDHVLRNVMSIFTFMGKNLIRQDDSYSFQIISQTIKTIVPALLQASKQQQEIQESATNDQEQTEKRPKAIQVIATIIRKFVDSLPDIPRHRQLPLFLKLISTLKSSDYLWVPIAQICERYAYPSKFFRVYTRYHMYKGEEDLDPTLEFAINFHQQFTLSVQLDTCLHLINHLSELPVTVEKGNSPKKISLVDAEFKEQVEPIDLRTCTDEKLQDYRKNVLAYINLWLSSQTFINLTTELGPAALCELETQYKALHQSTLSYMQTVNDASSQFFKASEILKLLQDLLNNINSHLPCRLFIRVIASLLKCTISTVQQNALQLLNHKLERNSNFFSQENNHKCLLKLMKKLLNIVKISLSVPEESSPKENIMLSRTALTSVYFICRLIGNKYPTKLHKVLNVVCAVLGDGKNRPSLLDSAFLCFTELCSSLNAMILPSLNSFMPNLMSMMEDHAVTNGNVLLALVKAVHGLVKNLGSFLSSYMDSIITNICILSAKYKNSKKDLQEALNQISVLVSKEIAPRVLIASIQQSCTKIIENNYEALGPLMNILAKTISETSRIEDFSVQLQSFYIEILAFRSSHFSGKAPLCVESVEKDIIDSLIVFVLKLSEPTFATFFNQIYTWATSLDLEDSRNATKTLTFFKLTCELSKTLKSLFVRSARKFAPHASSVLDALNASKINVTYLDSAAECGCLLNCIIDTLTHCLKYNDGQLGEREFFDVLMQPLVDQLENELGGDEAYKERIEQRLSGCIAHFMMLFSDSALWKLLNYQVLLKTRHSSAKVRFATLQVIREIVKMMDNNYLVLLPESIPFLAEIMEDESFEVEQECQNVIGEMEKILGEPIKTYF